MNSNYHNTKSFYIIAYYVGYIVLIMAILMLVPMATALLLQEWNPFLDFVISDAITASLGFLLIIVGIDAKKRKATVQWKHGFVIASFSWLLLMLLCAIPYILSGHSKSFLDACFDVMSGFTTTGLALTQDLEHLSNAMNMWRHMLTFIGGQGMVVLALTFLAKEMGGAYKMYVGEGKDIDLVPNVKGTARYIWIISMVYLAIGTLILWISGILIGLKPVSAFFHALYIFSSSWSTGGFAPMTQNIMYYHSALYENIAVVLFILGSLNFGLHYAIWHGNRREIAKNVETQSFFVTTFIAIVLAIGYLVKLDIYPNVTSLFRRIIFNILSAHTTTGFGNVYARQIALEWGEFGILIMIIVMLIGGSACSTAGGESV